jgi:hypothetical protein
VRATEFRLCPSRDGRILIGLTDRYAFERRELDGRVLRIERQFTPVPVEPGEAAQAREQTIRAIRSANDPNWRWNGPELSATKPVFRRILAEP